MKKTIISMALALSAALSLTAQPVITQEDSLKAAAIVSKMTLEEKCLLIAGQKNGFHTANLARVGVPSVRMADGPQGVRNDTKSTYYPCGMSLAASWNRDVVYGVGQGIAYDAKSRGVRVMLCPGVNIYRSALCGRNFEYYGEDPYLASETALSYIVGMQEQDVIATIKHFALNNQEYSRHETASFADERTINEIYFPTFRKAVEKGRVGAVMTAYNPVNGIHAAENEWLISNLRSWGHKGIVMSDWGSTYSTLGCLTSGLDLEMPSGDVMNFGYIKPMIEKGMIDISLIDAKCQHILQTFSAFGLFDNSHQDKNIPEDYEISRNNAYAAAVEGPVLLKNKGLLPLAPDDEGTIIVLGPNADKVAYGGGSGSMTMLPGRAVTLADALKKLGSGYNVKTLPALDFKKKEELSAARAVIYACGFNHDSETEGSDRKYNLPGLQSSTIAKIAEINPNIIVVVNSGGEFNLEGWFDKVNAVLLAWYGGQAGGQALADLIVGKANPSGRLPFTWWGSEAKNPTSAYYETCKPFNNPKRWRDFQYINYAEGIFMGYRGMKQFGVEPMFPFGFGLSYTQFEYSDINIVPSGDGFDVSFTVKNTGKKEGAEVAQVYVSPVSPSVVRPELELKGYSKVRMRPGVSETVTVHLGKDAFEHYETAIHGWKADPGVYKILVGASVVDIKLEGKVSF